MTIRLFHQQLSMSFNLVLKQNNGIHSASNPTKVFSFRCCCSVRQFLFPLLAYSCVCLSICLSVCLTYTVFSVEKKSLKKTNIKNPTAKSLHCSFISFLWVQWQTLTHLTLIFKMSMSMTMWPFTWQVIILVSFSKCRIWMDLEAVLLESPTLENKKKTLKTESINHYILQLIELS